jgi:hypothetical protein
LWAFTIAAGLATAITKERRKEGYFKEGRKAGRIFQDRTEGRTEKHSRKKGRQEGENLVFV